VDLSLKSTQFRGCRIFIAHSCQESLLSSTPPVLESRESPTDQDSFLTPDGFSVSTEHDIQQLSCHLQQPLRSCHLSSIRLIGLSHGNFASLFR